MKSEMTKNATENTTTNMTSNKRLAIIFLSILVFVMIVMSSFHGMDVQIDNEDMDGIGGFFGIVLGCGIAVVAVVFALSLTGMVLASVAVLLCVIFAVVVGSLALALLPLLLPILLVVGLVALFSRKTT